MSRLGYDRYRTAFTAECDQLHATIADADLSVKVPTCPEWTLAELLRHVGRAQRWAEYLVSTRATEYVADERPESAAPEGDDPQAMAAWLADGAARFAATLSEAGPDAPVWTWAPEQSPAFWARRMTHETAIHRADAAATTGAAYTVDPEIAADAIDEWLEIISNPLAVEYNPKLAELRGKGETIHLYATDAPAELAAHWVIELVADGIRWSRAKGEATVTVRGPLTDLLRVFYRRLPVSTDRVEISGDRSVLDFWLDRASFA
ncbi:maleylpyruvate isomerase family mycothiol-dependent enzyme [Streptomyces zagrosensis]|uniref:Uncharacterized protein (TIGR03083 family) n=1 Tax=Streptomyces zagrosensis TaxID=1042984 RepID=A0A7W9Q438_9ACTN|nr:maleylpyruvate isomerase family mycothiol-dependent enzyme [Streptomyces zagrosensis]MBB5933248.1 uncharacterized protein (TIGR03083 family) [Streptomyces zagrosensis]